MIDPHGSIDQHVHLRPFFDAPSSPACLGRAGCTAERGQTESGLALNQCFEPQMNQARLLVDPGIFPGLGNQIVVEYHGCPHAYEYASSICMSNSRTWYL